MQAAITKKAASRPLGSAARARLEWRRAYRHARLLRAEDAFRLPQDKMPPLHPLIAASKRIFQALPYRLFEHALSAALCGKHGDRLGGYPGPTRRAMRLRGLGTVGL